MDRAVPALTSSYLRCDIPGSADDATIILSCNLNAHGPVQVDDRQTTHVCHTVLVHEVDDFE